MGILQGLAGNMQQIDPHQAQAEYAQWLLQGEQIQSAFKTLRDGFCLTNFRIITLDHQGATGKKTRVKSIQLNSIIDVTAETAGAGLDDSEITITYVTTPRLRAHTLTYDAYRFEFPKNFDVARLYRHFMSLAQNNLRFINEG